MVALEEKKYWKYDEATNILVGEVIPQMCKQSGKYIITPNMIDIEAPTCDENSIVKWNPFINNWVVIPKHELIIVMDSEDVLTIKTAKEELASTDCYFTIDKYEQLSDARKEELRIRREELRQLIRDTESKYSPL